MRLALLATFLIATAAPRSGCGDGAASPPSPSASPASPGTSSSHGDCAGKACGDACNPCGPDKVCPTLAATACDRNGRCVTAVPNLCYDPCAGKACGDACQACPPGASDCAETMVVKACNAAGACVPLTPDLGCAAR